jgi:signal transduction histidine kinase
LVTISRIRTKQAFWASIRWKILLAFFVIVGLSFLVAATTLTGQVSDYLFEQRTREDSLLTEKLALSAAPLFQSVSVEELNELMEESAVSMNGRLMLIDMDGKIQYDTFQTLCGQRIQVEEALQVLTGNQTEAYGIHSPGRAVVEEMNGEKNADYLAYSAHEMTGFQGRIGVVLFVSRVQSMMDSMSTVRWRLLSVFAIIVIAALILALVLSQVLTKPITALSRTMRRMGKGDLSARVPVMGSGELRELAENYNTMAAQLESLDKTRNQFVSNASHELKTPLATMKIMLETMMYQPDMPAELRGEFMNDMNHEIDRLTGIITDLLVLTRMDNQGEMNREKVDMSELTQETVHLLQPAAEKKNQQLTDEIQPGLELFGDRIKLNQILYNLMDNAIKYTPENGKIHVSLKEEDGNLVWRVRDDGIGIPEEDQEHIFERFYRVDKARSRETGGTGLGLSIVRQMVKMHGGTISVSSKPDSGSEFTVSFPREGAA